MGCCASSSAASAAGPNSPVSADRPLPPPPAPKRRSSAGLTVVALKATSVDESDAVGPSAAEPDDDDPTAPDDITLDGPTPEPPHAPRVWFSMNDVNWWGGLSVLEGADPVPHEEPPPGRLHRSMLPDTLECDNYAVKNPRDWVPCTWAVDNGLCLNTACRDFFAPGACEWPLIGIQCTGDPPSVCMRHGLQGAPRCLPVLEER